MKYLIYIFYLSTKIILHLLIFTSKAMPPFPKFIHPQITVYYNQPQIHNNKYIYSYPQSSIIK